MWNDNIIEHESNHHQVCREINDLSYYNKKRQKETGLHCITDLTFVKVTESEPLQHQGKFICIAKFNTRQVKML